MLSLESPIRYACMWPPFAKKIISRLFLGGGWRLLEGTIEGQTQTDHPFLGDAAFFAHPIDVHLATRSMQGMGQLWPCLTPEEKPSYSRLAKNPDPSLASRFVRAPRTMRIRILSRAVLTGRTRSAMSHMATSGLVPRRSHAQIRWRWIAVEKYGCRYHDTRTLQVEHGRFWNSIFEIGGDLEEFR